MITHNGVGITCPLCNEKLPKLELVSHLHRNHGLSLWRVLKLLREMTEALGREVEAG
jgi:hypothetical protein